MTGSCFECGAPADVHHHVVPRARGGLRTVPLCDDCHRKAHDMRLHSLRAAGRERIVTALEPPHWSETTIGKWFR